MIIEQGKDGVTSISKRTLKGDGYTNYDDASLICVENYNSIDIDRHNTEFHIHVNSHLSYKVHVNDAKAYLSRILISENREQKLNQILQ